MADRERLERWVRASTTPQRVVRRSRIVLLWLEGLSAADIAARVDVSRPTFNDTLNLDDTPLAVLDQSKTRPSREVLEQINEEFR